MPSAADEFLTIARIQKTQGRRGEVAAEILTDFPDRFEAGAMLQLSSGLEIESRSLEASRFHKGRVILKFSGCDSISAAEALVGRWIVVPKEARRPLPPGVVYLADLVGCTVRERGESLGTVEGIEEIEQSAAPVLLRVRGAEGELLVPFAAEICRKVDVAKREIEVQLPEGLRELNRETRSPGERGAAAGRFRRRRSS